MNILTEDEIEKMALETLQKQGYEIAFGGDVARDYNEVVLQTRLQNAINKINPDVPVDIREEALRIALRTQSTNQLVNNENFHKLLTDGVDVKGSSPLGRGGGEGRSKTFKVWLVDFKNENNNEFVAINQFTIIEKQNNKRPDIIIFINGLPLVVIEIKNATDENATVRSAFDQLQTYKQAIPSLFNFNSLLIATDGWFAKAGTITSDFSRFSSWKTPPESKGGKSSAPTNVVEEPNTLYNSTLFPKEQTVLEMDIMLKGMLDKKTLLDIIRHFIVFEKTKDKTVKKVAAYHQYYAVNKAIVSTIKSLKQPSSPALLPMGEGSSYRANMEFSGLIKTARELRQKQTKAEEIFWEIVRNRKFLNLKFRRQHQIGHYIADFYCDEKRLVIELDGEIHFTEEQQKHDAKRDKFLTSSGFKVLRFTNQYFLETPELVLEEIALAVSPSPLGEGRGEGDGRAGVIWHTQGSGKSLSMVFYSGKLVLAPQLNNPTILVLTDRNDLDQQLFETFSNCQQLIRQTPVQAESRNALQSLLAVSSGGVIFTTIQKFLPNEKGGTYPKLSDRRNIVVIADEAHRSQYDFIDGYARHMRDALPNASFIGFTGTPIEKEDKNTQAIFGNYVDIYDIHQAVEDGATVRIFYENRLAKIELNEKEKQILDERIEDVTEEDELTERQQRFAKWTQQEAIVGSEKRLKQIAKDLVHHFEQRSEAFDGKGMIVCMSRRICVAMHNEIIQLRPEWYNAEDDKGKIKVIMTGSSSDPLDYQEHIRNKQRRKSIGDRLKDPKDELKLIIVRDMLLTGFDAPCLHTLYVDKPMTGHNLMQAIARVNRVFRDKEGGLIVDYLGIAQDLKKALSIYTDSGGKGKIEFNQEEAVAKMLELHEVVSEMFNSSPFGGSRMGAFDYKKFFGLQPKEKLTFILDATDFVLNLDKGKDRFNSNVINLSKAFALSVPHPEALKIRDDVSLFQAIKARITKLRESQKKHSDEEVETAIRQIISDALISTEVIDIFQAAGIDKPEISILSDEFLAEIKGMPRKNLALELLRRLLNDEIKNRSHRNIVQSKKFSELLADAIKRYQNNALSAAQIIDELIKLAKDIKQADKRGEDLKLDFRELAFYDALEVSDSAVKLLGDEVLKTIARELVDSVKKSVTIDWTIKESVQAKMRVIVKRILKKYGYPPDKQDQAVRTVLEQAKQMAEDFSENN